MTIKPTIDQIIIISGKVKEKYANLTSFLGPERIMFFLINNTITRTTKTMIDAINTPILGNIIPHLLIVKTRVRATRPLITGLV